jgi:gliding motility-associated-like protein
MILNCPKSEIRNQFINYQMILNCPKFEIRNRFISTMKRSLLIWLGLIFLSFSSLRAQVVYYEDFERGPSTTFNANAYYRDTFAYCNGYVTTHSGVWCRGGGNGSLSSNSVTTDVSPTGLGYFLCHITWSNPIPTTGLCWGTADNVVVTPNTTYVYSFWMSNIFNLNNAQIRPMINDVPIGAPVSSIGDGNSSWTKFSFCWNSGGSTSARLGLENMRDTQYGNSFCLDDIKLEKVTPPTIAQTLTICTGGSVAVGTHIYSAAGDYRDVLVSSIGCDSTVLTRVNVAAPALTSQSFNLCPDDQWRVGNHLYSAPGQYVDTLRTSFGCDSVVRTTIRRVTFKEVAQSPTICAGATLAVGIHRYSSSGVYLDSIYGLSGCDSIITTNLNVLPPLGSNNNQNVCYGKRLLVGTHSYSVAGVYRDTLRSGLGCDSFVTTNLRVLPNLEQTKQVYICEGESVKIGIHTYTQSGRYVDSLIGYLGCDSVVTTTVVKYANPNAIQIISLNGGDSVMVGRHVYRCSGEYIDSIASAHGCDSIVRTRIKAAEGSKVFVPNVFSPNGDGHNDYFTVFAGMSCVAGIVRMAVFDRWGEQVFYRENFQPNVEALGWDGRFRGLPAGAGVYGYWVEVVYVGGGRELFSGDVGLVR